METDWEEDDILSELDDGDSSPRLSLDSVSTLLAPITRLCWLVSLSQSLVPDAKFQISREAGLA